MEGAGLHALAAGLAELLVDGVNALGVLGDGVLGAGLGALAALGADDGLHSAVALAKLDAGESLVKGLEVGVGAGLHTGLASLTLDTLLNNKFLNHIEYLTFLVSKFPSLYSTIPKKST